MKKYYFISSIVIIMLIAALSGCKKFVDIGPDENQLTGKQVFSSDSAALKAVAGIYIDIMKEAGVLNGLLSKYAALYTDELSCSPDRDMDARFLNTNLTADYIPLIACWKRPYEYIKGCNNVIEGLGTTSGVNSSLKAQLIGEAKFLRALAYLYLVNLFGDVPLVLGTNYETNAAVPRTASAQVKAQIINDLKEAIALLPVIPEGTSSPNNQRIKPGKWAAAALLARVYLYNEQWQEAEAMASAVIRAGIYHLSENLNDVFLKGSEETIFQLQPVVKTFNTIEGSYFLNNPGSRPVYEATTGLLNSFEADDQRKVNWLKPVSTYYGIYKYKVLKDSLQTEYNIVLRLSEQYLIRSEASARQGRIPEALADINYIRKRAQLPALSDTLRQAEVLLAIANERRHEFFAEFGHRFMDLKRWYNTPAHSDPLWLLAEEAWRTKKEWQPFKNLWPVPESEIKLNKLIQNPDY